jgi:hypothetical protein
MTFIRKALPRRTFLKGAGAAVALPFLEAMVPAGARAQSLSSPVRMAFVYVPNGIDMRHWNPAYEELSANFREPCCRWSLSRRTSPCWGT